jgi:hypothetical protein
LPASQSLTVSLGVLVIIKQKKIKSLIKEAKKQREEEGTEKEAAEESQGGEGGEELTRLVISIKEWVNELPVCGDIKIEFVRRSPSSSVRSIDCGCNAICAA